MVAVIDLDTPTDVRVEDVETLEQGWYCGLDADRAVVMFDDDHPGTYDLVTPTMLRVIR